MDSFEKFEITQSNDFYLRCEDKLSYFDLRLTLFQMGVRVTFSRVSPSSFHEVDKRYLCLYVTADDAY